MAEYIIAKLSLSGLMVVSREAKKKQHAQASSGLRDHYTWVIYTDGSSKILKCYNLATIAVLFTYSQT